MITKKSKCQSYFIVLSNCGGQSALNNATKSNFPNVANLNLNCFLHILFEAHISKTAMNSKVPYLQIPFKSIFEYFYFFLSWALFLHISSDYLNPQYIYSKH